ncbi:MAG: hypothetical protein BroJett021_52470 [Chloroflexota bacterium]|nr:MAG: hypothetical protein BroJett021_52470 [Chloroflexota bacterium]
MFQLVRTRNVRPYCSSVALEEEKAWVAFYRRLADPAIAAEVIQHLDADAELKRTHPALYLRCKETLRKNKARLARTKRIRTFMRRILGALRRDQKSSMRPRLRHPARSVVKGIEAPRNPKAA